MGTAVFGAPEFKAASGRTVTAGSDGSLSFGKMRGYLGPEQVFDAEEYFQAKNDERLGRWRYPLNPDFVVYSNADGSALVVSESTGASLPATRGNYVDSGNGTIYNAAAAYFEAHPEQKPWEDAKRGDVWLFLSAGNGRALAWRADRNWDVTDQMGSFHSRVEDVPALLREQGYPGWESPTAELLHRIEDPS